jgi:hypothetical protein
MAVISGLPEAVSSQILLTCLTALMVPPQMTWISSGVPITIVLPKPAPAASAPLNFDFGRVVPLDLDRPSWWNLPHRGFPSLKKTDMTISQGRGGRTNLTAYQYQVIRSSESRDETKYGTCDFPLVLVWFFFRRISLLRPCARYRIRWRKPLLIWLGI